MKQIIRNITFGLATLMATIACSDTFLSESGFKKEVDMDKPITFSSVAEQHAATTRSIAITEDIKDYKPLPSGYKLNIQMMEDTKPEATEDSEDRYVEVGKNDYSIVKEGTAYTETKAGVKKEGYPTTLTPSTGTNGFYWPSSTKKYGFIATAGLDEIPADQSDATKQISADRLLGYAGTNALHNAIVYKTAKDWYKENVTDTIPLYLKHQCAMISIVLKAGEGVWETALSNDNVGKTLSDTIFSYGHPAQVEVENEDGTIIPAQTEVKDVVVTQPYHESYTWKENEGTDNEKEYTSAKFTAIVEPYNYAENPSKLITRIVINGQKYSFYSSNDDKASAADGSDDKKAWKDAYNLEAGDHILITITVGRDGRIIEVFAQQKDWEIALEKDLVTDDFGLGTDPVLIHCGETTGNKSKTEQENSLEDFLANTLGKNQAASEEDQQNKKGVIAILNNSIRLTSATADKLMDLNAILNLNGYTITTTHAVFSKIAESGVLKNGTIAIEGSDAKYAVGESNEGTIDKITVKTAVDENGDVVSGNLTTAGLVGTNNSEIRNCVNNVKVKGGSTTTENYIGGIAAIQTQDGLIANCVVNGKVCTASMTNNTTTLGGIVGKAAGSVTGCTYEYGITMMQKGGKVKNNIIGEKDASDGATLTASNNAWSTKNTKEPTKDTEMIGGNNYIKPFDDVIDYPAELKELCDHTKDETSGHNGRYRVADSFEITDADKWDPFETSNKTKDYNLYGNLDGNYKTITTNGKMIFQGISGELKNLTVMLNKPVLNTYLTVGEDNSIVGDVNNVQSSFACAPLAKAVTGTSAIVDNVNVLAKDANCFVASPNPAGLVSSATDGATINNCRTNVSLKVYAKFDSQGMHLYAGGIVSQAKNVTITNCMVGHDVIISVSNKPEGDNSLHIYAGGIIGGLNWGETNEASIITDNACFSTKFLERINVDNDKVEPYPGAIIGYCGNKTSICFTNATDNLGNWWHNDIKPVGRFYNTGDTFSAKNSFTPTFKE